MSMLESLPLNDRALIPLNHPPLRNDTVALARTARICNLTSFPCSRPARYR